MQYKNFTLDQFQIDAITAIDNNHSVVVSAATGTGKTLIADYIIEKAIKNNQKVIYTSPIKALSNQKFREFKEQYEDKVGLLTGDIAINASAPILIMTTEIYRNMLLENEDMSSLSYVVFDEIHYINDIERGTVWEESLIFSPKNVRFLCLSATIPNYKEFADWIATIKEHTVETVNYMKRAVPLEHTLYDIHLGQCTIKELKQNDIPSYYQFRKGKKNQKKSKHPVPNYLDIIKMLKQKEELPAIYFTFSRKDAFSKGYEIAKKFDYTNVEEKNIIRKELNNIPENIRHMQSVKELKYMLIRGFGVHHAGILPQMKEVVENLFATGAIKILFATETFAVGINMPAKTVILNAIKKYDGISVRYLSTKEYFQMAGRAGRRGIDEKGRVIVIVNRNDLDMNELERVTSKDVEPIISRFSISYNTVLNLIKSHNKEERDIILKSNFGYFLKKGNQNRIDQSYYNYVHVLRKMGYVEKAEDENDPKDYAITWKGAFAVNIYSHELVLSELYYDGIFQEVSDIDLVTIIAGLEYEGRMADKFYIKKVNITKILNALSKNSYVMRHLKKKNLKDLLPSIRGWMQGQDFSEILEYSNLAEGDIIRLFRRLIDNLKQLKAAALQVDDTEFARRMDTIADKIDRDIVSVVF